MITVLETICKGSLPILVQERLGEIYQYFRHLGMFGAWRAKVLCLAAICEENPLQWQET